MEVNLSLRLTRTTVDGVDLTEATPIDEMVDQAVGLIRHQLARAITAAETR